MRIKKISNKLNEGLSEVERAEEYKDLIKEVSDYILDRSNELTVAPETHDIAKSLIDIAEMFGGVDDFRYKLNNIDSTKDNDPLTLWGIKNSDEYAVYAKSKNQAIRKFKKDLGIDVKSNSIEIID